jgi:hypothetical protein
VKCASLTIDSVSVPSGRIRNPSALTSKVDDQ